MRNYELTIVLDGKSTPAKKKSVGKSVEDLIKTNKGKVKKMDDWGKKELAYTMGKSVTGIYIHYKLELEPVTVKLIKEKLRLDENVIRYLLIREGR